MDTVQVVKSMCKARGFECPDSWAIKAVELAQTLCAGKGAKIASNISQADCDKLAAEITRSGGFKSAGTKLLASASVSETSNVA